MVVVFARCVVLLQEVFCGVLWCLRGCGQPKIPTNVRVARGFSLCGDDSWRVGNILQGQPSSDAVAASRRALGTAGRGGCGFPTASPGLLVSYTLASFTPGNSKAPSSLHRLQVL